MNCTIDFPRNSSIVSGNFTVKSSGCNGTRLDFDCFTSTFLTACAAAVSENDTSPSTSPFIQVSWLYVQVNFGNRVRDVDGQIPYLRRTGVPQFFNERVATVIETMAVIARYLVHDPFLSPMEVFFLATHQAAPNTTVLALLPKVNITVADARFFMPSLGIIISVLGICYCLGLVGKLAMMYTKTDHFEVGVSPEQVAQLTTMEHGKRRERTVWYLKLHPHSPCITVSTDPINMGKWAEEEIKNKYKTA